MRAITGVALAALVAAPAVGAVKPPEQLVKDTASAVIERVKAEREALRQDPKRLHALVDEMIIPHFDFELMARFVLGKHWKRADAATRERFIHEFKELLIRTYATALLEYSNQTITYESVPARKGARVVTVKSTITQPAGKPLPIVYKLRRVGDEWKVIDVSIDGVSLISTYRSTFSSEIREKGLDGLINSLAERNAEPER